MESLFEVPLFMYATARSAQYAFQYNLLHALGAALPGSPLAKNRKPSATERSAPDEATIRKELLDLLRKDGRQIVQGLYPISVLRPESPVDHALRIPKLMADGLAIFARRRRGRTTEFGPEARELLQDLPRYYHRNFHFQTDGYLSERSASLYEHQVEMLFRGSADAMRRLILPPLKKHFADRPDGRGLRLLEIGAGTGRTTRFVQLAFPKARIIATDLSPVYLRQARKKMNECHRIDFLQADGGDLPFSDCQFDGVYSVFLFHELPMQARRQILAETKRVLKPGGFFGMVDSIQNGDKPSFDSLLSQFPIEYHEPFFRDYAEHLMQPLVAESGFESIAAELGFFSKAVWGTKNCSL